MRKQRLILLAFFAAVCVLYVVRMYSISVKNMLSTNPRLIFSLAKRIRNNANFLRNSVVSNTLENGQSFLKTLEPHNWEDFRLAVIQKNDSKIRYHVNEIISILTPFLIKEPKISINQSCSSPLLRKQIVCKTGKLTEPKKIGLLLQFGFDVDVLEIHLNELDKVVDKFFIIEATHSHASRFLKPLVWERVKYQERFKRFLPKIVHFVMDDAQSINVTIGKADFQAERLQEKLRWLKFLEWNNATVFFKTTDLIGFGDSDEIASRETVNLLKHCELESDPIDVGIWFPYGSLDSSAFLTDFPVYEHPFTLGDPTFWTLGKALDFKTVAYFKSEYPSRNRGKSASHVLGGIHMTNYPYLPFLLIKRLTQSEGDYNYIQQVVDFSHLSKEMTITQLAKFYSEEYFKKMGFRVMSLDRVKSIDPERDEIVILPWFYNCNRFRYPSWEGKSDSRLE